MGRRGAVDRRDRVARADGIRHAPLEAIDVRSDRRDPAGVETMSDVVPLVPVNLGSAERNGFGGAECAGRRGGGGRHAGTVCMERSGTIADVTRRATSAMPSATVTLAWKPSCSVILANETR